MEYYGSCLNQIERKIYNKILDALQRRLLFVKVEGVTDIKVLKKCISAVQYDYANLFYVDFSYYTYVAYSDGWEYRPQYLYEKEEMLRKQKIIDELICRIGFELKKRNLLSIYQKCGYIHSYLVRNCTYDHAALDDSDKRSAKMIVVCPECSTKSNADNGVLPLSCSACGYFFQAGIDKIISEADLKDNKKTVKGFSVPAKVSSTVNTDTARVQGGPLKRVTKDTTSLRITSITSNTFLPELMKEAGNIIGKNGTVFRSFVSNKQISIWHTATGWYARATIGTPLYNGVPMNQGVQVKLSAGDLLVIDQEQFMIELF